MVEARRNEVLRALVEEHIRTGEPVSSRAIVERGNLEVSTATVRNDLAALESEGLVAQPHTSAGRVPTPGGYRYYVDQISPADIGRTTGVNVDALGEVHLELSKLLRATSDLLAEITELPSVVVAPGVVRDRVRSLHTVQVTNDQVLIVVVTESGRVVQQRGRVRTQVTPLEVEEAQRLVAAAVVGQELGMGFSVDETDLAAVSGPTREAVLTICDGLHLATTGSTEMFVGGAQRTQAWDDFESVQRILEILEREAEVMKLLAGASETSIQLGSEIQDSDIDLAVVSKTYESGAEGGSVGVIGPMRMNYKRAISAVEEVTRELEGQIGSRSE